MLNIDSRDVAHVGTQDPRTVPAQSLTALAGYSDDDLIAATRKAAADERHATVALIALLAELDARRLYLGQGCSSLFAYLTTVLHLSEHAAYHRIEAARAARQFPVILDHLAAGELTLTTVGLLRPHLTADNHIGVLAEARHRSKRDVERLIATLAPQPTVAPLVRRLPVVKPLSVGTPAITQATAVPARHAPAPAEPAAAQSHAQNRPSPGSDDAYLLRVTISGDTHSKLQRARNLLRHAIPSGDPAAILDRALTLLVAQLERTKFASTARPRPRRTHAGKGRHIPAAVKRVVWERDGGRCTFAGAEGRCAETSGLEYHHQLPYARGGPADANNLTLRCRAHNAYDARLAFGDRVPSQSRAASR